MKFAQCQSLSTSSSRHCPYVFVNFGTVQCMILTLELCSLVHAGACFDYVIQSFIEDSAVPYYSAMLLLTDNYTT